MSLVDPAAPGLVGAFLGRRRSAPRAQASRRDPMFRSSGNSFDLKALREWQSSDDPRRVDWRLAARSGRLWVKEFYEEESDGACVLVDLSSSLEVLDGPEGGLALARSVGATLAWILGALGLPTFLILHADRPLGLLDRARPSAALGLVESFFSQPVPAGRRGTDLVGALALARRSCRWRRLVLVSDFLDPRFSPLASPFSRNSFIRLHRPLSTLADTASELLVEDPETGALLGQPWDGPAQATHRRRLLDLEAGFREAGRRGAFSPVLEPGGDRRALYWSFLEALHA